MISILYCLKIRMFSNLPIFHWNQSIIILQFILLIAIVYSRGENKNYCWNYSLIKCRVYLLIFHQNSMIFEGSPNSPMESYFIIESRLRGSQFTGELGLGALNLVLIHHYNGSWVFGLGSHQKSWVQNPTFQMCQRNPTFVWTVGLLNPLICTLTMEILSNTKICLVCDNQTPFLLTVFIVCHQHVSAILFTARPAIRNMSKINNHLTRYV